MNIEEWINKTIKELQKHADRDECYDCKQLLKERFVEKYIKTKSDNNV